MNGVAYVYEIHVAGNILAFLPSWSLGDTLMVTVGDIIDVDFGPRKVFQMRKPLMCMSALGSIKQLAPIGPSIDLHTDHLVWDLPHLTKASIDAGVWRYLR